MRKPPLYGKLLFTCGTKTVRQDGHCYYRVVCATCEAGGTVGHEKLPYAVSAAVRDSNKPCRSCGAK